MVHDSPLNNPQSCVHTTPLRPHIGRVVTLCVCRYWVVTRLLTGCVRPRPCVREPCLRGLDAAWGVGICRIVFLFARVCRVGVWFSFVRSALLLAVGTCIVLSFEAMPGLCCFLCVTPSENTQYFYTQRHPKPRQARQCTQIRCVMAHRYALTGLCAIGVGVRLTLETLDPLLHLSTSAALAVPSTPYPQPMPTDDIIPVAGGPS